MIKFRMVSTNSTYWFSWIWDLMIGLLAELQRGLVLSYSNANELKAEWKSRPSKMKMMYAQALKFLFLHWLNLLIL